MTACAAFPAQPAKRDSWTPACASMTVFWPIPPTRPSVRSPSAARRRPGSTLPRKSMNPKRFVARSRRETLLPNSPRPRARRVPRGGSLRAGSGRLKTREHPRPQIRLKSEVFSAKAKSLKFPTKKSLEKSQFPKKAPRIRKFRQGAPWIRQSYFSTSRVKFRTPLASTSTSSSMRTPPSGLS